MSEKISTSSAYAGEISIWEEDLKIMLNLSIPQAVERYYGGDYEKAKTHTYAETLRFSQQLGYLGDDLPCGSRMNSDSCVIARATGYIVGSMHVTHVEKFDIINLPTPVKIFIALFDHGYFPELVDTESPVSQWQELAEIQKQEEKEPVNA